MEILSEALMNVKQYFMEKFMLTDNKWFLWSTCHEKMETQKKNYLDYLINLDINEPQNK